MAQVYEMEEEYPTIEEKEDEEQNNKTEQPLGDVYDIYGMASNVHSKHTDMTRDYTLAKYNSGLINEKFPKFIREQRKVVRILKSFMVVPESVLQRRYNTKEKAKQIHLAMKKAFTDVQELLLGEIDEMVIISRAGKGNVITAMLMHGKSKEEQEEYEQAVEGDGIKSRLTEKSK